MPERRTVQFKAPIAGNSKAIAKIGKAELAHFNKQMLIHELIRDSLKDSATFQCHVFVDQRRMHVRRWCVGDNNVIAA